MYKKFLKRLFDFIISLFLLILISPIFFLTYIVVRICIGSPAVFKQKRPGKNEKIFTIYKFRTMTNQKDVSGKLLPDEDRLLPIGKFIRKSSIDELPQLINVLKGEMSFIGPRPLLVDYLPLYTEKQKNRHLIRPGITGLAQVNGRNAISWEEKFEYDIYYSENLNFMLDVKILILTIKKVFLSEDINQKDKATAERFNGSE